MKSMTAYARGETTWENLTITLEMRTLNHRYRDIILKLPQKLSPLEEKVKQFIAEHIARGRVECTVKISGDMEGLPKLTVNWEAAKIYYHLLEELKKGLHLEGNISLDMFLGVKDIFTTVEEDEHIEKFWSPLQKLLEEVLENINAMRIKEGENLKLDLEQRLQLVHELLNKIQERAPVVLENYRKRLKHRVEELLDNEVDEIRLAQEIVFFAERSDITEEIVRLKSHLHQFRELFSTNEPVGRKLDFLLQEMHREANTLGVKANDFLISQQVVEIKAEIEKIRQQVQNIE
ncbi:MAG: YicC family protein [Candidatus Desulfofervidaceae bacterium]|nr:YicC family protein [Candidatus Desulfofervidaceae bacterium]